MRIGLINPPSPFLSNERVFVTLGILRVASYLKQENHSVNFLDLSGKKDYLNSLFSLNDCDFIGITSTTPQIPIVTDIALYLKEKMGKKVILGGPHVTMINSAYKKFKNNRPSIELDRLRGIFYSLICGDGELAIISVIENDVKFIDSEEDEAFYLTNYKYNSLPLPDRDLIDLASYNYAIEGKKTTNIIGQMGCPFGCNFCSGRLSKTFKSVRNRDMGSILKEIDLLYKKYGYTGFMFYDDELNINRQRFITFLDLLIEYQTNNNVSLKLRGFTRTDLLDQEQLDKMFLAGFRWLLTGFESGSDRMLLNMNKGNSVADNTRASLLIRNSGLKIKALMSIGHPGESKETIKETSDWLNYIKPDETDITIIAPYPGSPYHDNTVWNINKGGWEFTATTGDKLYSVDIDYSKDSVFYKTRENEYNSYVFTDYLSREDLVKERLKMGFKK